MSDFWFCREPKGHFPGERATLILHVCVLLGPAFRRGMNQACFVSLLQLLPVCSHLPAQARLWSTNHVDPDHNPSRQGFTAQRRDLTGQQPVGAETMIKKQGGCTCNTLFWFSPVTGSISGVDLLEYDKKSLLLAFYTDLSAALSSPVLLSHAN